MNEAIEACMKSAVFDPCNILPNASLRLIRLNHIYTAVLEARCPTLEQVTPFFVKLTTTYTKHRSITFESVKSIPTLSKT